MTETGFRDLFAELPRALFETLQAMGEAAVERARAPATGLPRSSTFAWLDKLGPMLCDLFGWREFLRVEVDPLEHWRVLVVRLDCGHPQRYKLDEISLLRAYTTSEKIDLVMSIIESTERHCQCVQRPTERSR